MKVLIIGAHGQIGQLLVKILQESTNCQVIAGLRSHEQEKAYQEKEITTAFVDLSGPQGQLAKAMQTADTVVFAAGSGGKTGADATMMIDLDGAVKAINAAKETDIKRFIMISAIKSDDRSFWSDNVPAAGPQNYYYAAKYYADQWLLRSSLDYTILRPVALTNQKATGKIKIAQHFTESVADMSITRQDVAQTIADIILTGKLHQKEFDIASGTVPIKQAITNFH